MYLFRGILALSFFIYNIISSVIQSCSTLCDPMNFSTPGYPVHHQLPELTQTHAHRVSDAIQPSHALSSPSPTFNPSQHQSLFQWVSSSHQVAKVWEFSLQHFTTAIFSEYSGLISFRMDWLHLLAVQGTLKSLFQHHSSKASILWCSAFFIVHLSHPCLTTGSDLKNDLEQDKWWKLGALVQDGKISCCQLYIS